ncbi:MAG: hypothetical protein HYX34_15295 [Actinobacteria bacterium]|nr:hypothetical protein [Actinomycetota bacterium]
MPDDTPSPEAAVRLYLLYLQDPTSLVDKSAVEAAQREVDAASDPIDKLKALAALERAKRTDAGELRAAFIGMAKQYAEAEGIPVSAFLELGVAEDVLADAGWDVGRARRRSRRGSPAPSSNGHGRRSRAPRVSIADVKEAAMAIDGPFTLNDVAERAGGGSPATVRKAVEELVDSGRVVRLGPAPGHHGPGRAPTRYARA